MKRSTIVAEFQAAPQTVWDIVTDNPRALEWRSDLARIEVAEDGLSFTEYAKGGGQTHFRITEQRPCTFYAFEMEHQNFTGTWTGEFAETATGGTRIIFTENIRMKSPILRVLAVFLLNLKKQQTAYVADLRRKLGEA